MSARLNRICAQLAAAPSMSSIRAMETASTREGHIYLILGGGMQGMICAKNLAERKETAEVYVGDINQPRSELPDHVHFIKINGTKKSEIRAALRMIGRKVNAAICCLPGSIGLTGLTHLIDLGLPTVDLSFAPRLPYHLDAKAKEKNIPVVVDIGVAPGMSHVLVGDAHRQLGGLDSAIIYVGGVPIQPPPVFKHVVLFNAFDLLSEYIRPARARVDGKDVELVPLDTFEKLKDEEIGELEAFVSDGLRSLLLSYKDVPEMKEVTLRIPGHLDCMKQMRLLGFMEGDDATKMFARKISELYPDYKYADRTLMEVWCRKGDKRKVYRLHVLRKGGVSSMSRSTAFATAAAASLMARGLLSKPGVHPPERIGEDPVLTKAFLEDLAAHGVIVEEKSRMERLQ